MISCPRPCPLCAGREFYILPVGDRWICSTCSPRPETFVPVTLAWVDA